MEGKKFTIDYENQPNEVVDTIASALAAYGLDIVELEGASGTQEYEIVTLK